MEHEHSDDEWGFWGPDRTRRLRRPRRGDEPTRQLDAISPGSRRHGADPTDAIERPAAAVAEDPLGLFDDLGPADEFPEIDEMLGVSDVAVVSTTRRTWRQRLGRDERGRLDPLLTRLSIVLVAGALIVPVAVAASTNADAPGGTLAGTSTVAVVPSVATVAVTDASTAAASAVPQAASTAATPSAAATAAPTSAPASATNVGVAAAPAANVTTAPVAAAATPTERAQSGTETVRTCGSDYEVLAGDYWLGIADRADVDVDELLAANGATSDTPLYPGRTVCLPTGATVPVPAPTTVATTAKPTTVKPTTTDTPTTTKSPTTTDAPATTKAPATAKAPATTAPTTTKAPTSTKAPATTAPPTTAPPTTQPARTYTRAEVAQIIRDVWPDDLEDKAIAIATRESNLVPSVRNYCCFGLFQIYFSVHAGWLAGMGVTDGTQLYDPVVNAKAALALYFRDGGWGPWGG